MPSLQGSEPFSLSVDEWKHHGLQLGLAIVGAAGVYGTTVFLPDLKDHISSQFGVLIVAVSSAALPWLINFLTKFLTQTPTVTVLKALLVMLLFGAGGAASGADVLLNTTGAPPGKYVLTLSADGTVASIVPLGQTINLVGPQPPPPGPSPLTDRAKAIQAAALKVTGDTDRAGTAHGLAELYRQIAIQVRTPNAVKDLPSLVSAVSAATNMFLASRGPSAAQAWQPVRDQFSTQWTVLTAGSKPLAEYAVLLDECASGLDASAPQSRGISPEMLQFIMQIIQLILKLLMPTP